MPTFRELQFTSSGWEATWYWVALLKGIFAIQWEAGKGQEKEKEREEGRAVRTEIVVIIFLRLTSRSIFDNRENDLPYSTYVAVISV